MASDHIIMPMDFDPGIQRDGPQFNSQACVDGQWVRFYNKKPIKIGGYEVIDSCLGQDITRSMLTIPQSSSVDTYVGRYNNLSFFTSSLTTTTANLVNEINRTPTEWLANTDKTYKWSLDSICDESLTDVATTYVIALPTQNVSDVTNSSVGTAYYADISTTDQFIPIPSPESSDYLEPQASGGVVCVSPFIFLYGNNGVVQWSLSTNFMEFPIEQMQIIDNTKIVAAAPTRGGGVPAALFWSLSSLIRATQSGTDENENNVVITEFDFDTIETNISIMSSSSVVKYNQSYFWPGIDQFYVFNGVVQTLDNSMNNLYFFNSMNYEQRQKVWGMALPKFKEIWWFFPNIYGDNPTECNWAVIYNVKDNCWYDTPIPRSAGVPPSILPYPIMASSSPVNNYQLPTVQQTYPIWYHEYEYDAVSYNDIAQPIKSYFTTPYYSFASSNPQQDMQLRTLRIEPNFDQVGDMTVEVITRSYPEQEDTPNVTISTPYTFNADAGTVIEGKIDMRQMGRFTNYRFTSNTVGGYYFGGKTLLNVQYGDTRP